MCICRILKNILLTLTCTIVANPILYSISAEFTTFSIMNLKDYSRLSFVTKLSWTTCEGFEDNLPVSHTLRKLLCIDQQFAGDCISIFDNILYNHHHIQSFEHAVD